MCLYVRKEQAEPMVQPRLNSSWNDGGCGTAQPVQSISDKPDLNAVIQLMGMQLPVGSLSSIMHMLQCSPPPQPHWLVQTGAILTHRALSVTYSALVTPKGPSPGRGGIWVKKSVRFNIE